MSADQILFRFYRHGDRWAERRDPELPWTTYFADGRVQLAPETEFDHRWTEPVHLGELLSMYSDGHTSIRQLAEKYLRYSIGNEGLHRDLQRQVFVDILRALGDDPTGIWDRLAESRVVDVTPAESALDGADIALESVRMLAKHQGLTVHERDLLGFAEGILAQLHDWVQDRAAADDERRGRAAAMIKVIAEMNPQEDRRG